VGSGSVYALGIVDQGLDWNMKDEDAYELGRRAIYHATYRDAYSGGYIRGKWFKSLISSNFSCCCLLMH